MALFRPAVGIYIYIMRCWWMDKTWYEHLLLMIIISMGLIIIINWHNKSFGYNDY